MGEPVVLGPVVLKPPPRLVNFIVSSDGEVECFDLRADPDELSPLELSADEIEAACARARVWWEAHPVEAGEIELDEEQRARMGALGYGS